MNIVACLFNKAIFWGILLFSSGMFAQEKGHLVIIGGGKRPAVVMKKVVDLAGGAESKILIIPLASSIPLDVALFQKYQLEKQGAGMVDFILGSRETLDHDSTLAKLDGISGIFFSGGDQNRLTAALAGTRFLERIKTIYQAGGTIAGTSAGAAVMSEIMITGNEKLASGQNPEAQSSPPAFRTIRAGNIETSAGFGFLRNAIIDQHFIRRKRHNRLISLVLEHPALSGIGIDESTAVIIQPGQILEVIGENTVMIFDASSARHITEDSNGNLSAFDIRMHLLQAGQRFNLRHLKLLN